MDARSISWVLAVGICAFSAVGCAAGSYGDDTGSPRPDAGGSDGGRSDGGPRDAGGTDARVPDGGDSCAGVTCAAFQYCDSGRCRDYPGCSGGGLCDRPGDVCHNRRCVPGTVDVDGDGSPAAEDCDETDPRRSPLAEEVCSGIDEDCDDEIDEGDPAALCAAESGICIDGACGCPEGTLDLDRAVPGCECSVAPPLGEGQSCEGAIDLGDLADTGRSLTVNGNVLPAEREVWYRFRGVDEADTTCDDYHVRAQLLVNPESAFEITVHRGSCGTIECEDSGFTDYRWATDFRETIAGTLTGQCPCFAPGATPTADVSACADDTAAYFVRVRRRAGATLSCPSYTIELSNGLYDTTP